ncbi:MAG TPA: tetratricopeptide repeat protein [Kofleriaceae bacterium]|nr:tetratricopeptide repeat protein [Kofleriaceae bacterium]
MADGTAENVAMDPFEQHLVSGGELLRQDRVKEARAEFENALRLRVDDPKALGLLGLALFRLAAFRDAAPVYEKLVIRNPTDSSLRLNLGLVYLKTGDASRAIVELTRSRELDPSQTRAVSYLGLAYARNGEYDRAYHAFLQAGQSDLAREMEQYLTEEQKLQIQAMVRPPSPERASDAYDAVHVEAVDRPVVATVAPPPAAPLGSASLSPAVGQGALEDTPFARAATATPLLPEKEPGGVVAAEAEERSAVSLAVESAAPSAAAATAGTRTAAGHQPPQPLSEFATARLIRPEDGDHALEIGAGGVLLVRVNGKVMSRTEGVVVSGGDLAYEPATRRVRGAQTTEPFGADGRHLFHVSGKGHLVAAPAGDHFTAVMLDDDILYLREDLVYAFEDALRWENGNVPGSAAAIRMVQLRGSGAVAFRSARPLLSVKLAPERVLYVDADALAGWIGRVVPRLVAPAAGGKASAPFVECSGEGVILLEERKPTP